ncbi:MAG: hypothetical protein HYW03_05100 [Deltaproteobacteria bacterium]|nr:hypothetical protein [Deltaproteobacteria bacterium]MBI3065620.1 hypothetical protein [Deltaproteobacteria bacterium]
MTVALLTAAVFYLSDENEKRVKFFVVKSFRGNKRKRITKDLTPMADLAAIAQRLAIVAPVLMRMRKTSEPYVQIYSFN